MRIKKEIILLFKSLHRLMQNQSIQPAAHAHTEQPLPHCEPSHASPNAPIQDQGLYPAKSSVPSGAESKGCVMCHKAVSESEDLWKCAGKACTALCCRLCKATVEGGQFGDFARFLCPKCRSARSTILVAQPKYG